jgi:hypothetical protein
VARIRWFVAGFVLAFVFLAATGKANAYTRARHIVYSLASLDSYLTEVLAVVGGIVAGLALKENVSAIDKVDLSPADERLIGRIAKATPGRS